MVADKAYAGIIGVGAGHANNPRRKQNDSGNIEGNYETGRSGGNRNIG